jgi:CRISPR/Cas system CMR subunit Cmr6 (Cas7 group RAMP superfamily)
MKYKIELFNYWHCGTGLSGANDVSQLCVKDRFNLPFIPGKTLKGLIRDAAFEINKFQGEDWESFISRVFGKCKDRRESDSGNCFFSNAEFSEGVKDELLKDKQNIHFLFKKIYSTSIDENSQTKAGSLRSLEVCVPLMLFAAIKSADLGKEDEAKLKICLSYIKRLGLNRNRGLGQCNISPVEEC